MNRTADISECGRYRYSLTREWDSEKPKLGFIMLNPSTADADVDDPTIRRCIGFAKRDGYGGIWVVNLFAWRATKPSDIPWNDGVAIGPRNVESVRECCLRCPVVVAAWGAPKNAYIRRNMEHAARVITTELGVLGLTKDRYPRHPLYMPADAGVFEWIR